MDSEKQYFTITPYAALTVMMADAKTTKLVASFAKLVKKGTLKIKLPTSFEKQEYVHTKKGNK